VTWPVFSEGIELTHAVPVLGDLLGVDGLIGALIKDASEP
jgi:hypothetical protein